VRNVGALETLVEPLKPPMPLCALLDKASPVALADAHLAALDVNPRGGTPFTQLQYSLGFAATSTAIMDEKLLPRWARQDFRAWQATHSVLDTLVARIVRGNPAHSTAGCALLMPVGDEPVANQALRKAMPTVTLARALVKGVPRAHVYAVNEWGTTNGACAACGHDRMGDVTARPTRHSVELHAAREAAGKQPRPLGTVHTVPGLKACPRCGRLQLRDVGAALAMTDVLHAALAGEPRPARLTPGPSGKLPPAPKSVFLRQGEHARTDRAQLLALLGPPPSDGDSDDGDGNALMGVMLALLVAAATEGEDEGAAAAATAAAAQLLQPWQQPPS
jgi:hypothetical protein